jgi:apolipoprotein D and lipocalin family protein
MHRFASLIPLTLACIAPPLVAADLAPVQTVPKVEVQRFLGTWYQIATFPRFYQDQCVADAVAEYSANDDGTVAVKNRCKTRDGSINEATGTATPVEGSNNAKMEVSFIRPFHGDYWVIGLDPNYRWSVVGSPNRKSLWILSRTPKMPKDELNDALATASAQGFPLQQLQYTPQDQ